ncbi:hypothetical protein GPL15_07885 [Clostridium sp. MCC353]|uniref:TadE/TadG family type IV pilus assembly protein n=1 Tax=Clostridium sp. MCC353 TaxID=2592646 RepID=UPI001C0244A7|nr:TadE family protein [Clostridium sp. MCC353]MBT9776422.1 hypothetical protein [Clostridium sp. MCC353]
MLKKEKGSLTVEAAIVLVIFIFGYISIITIGSFIRAQMIIQYSITQAAKDISAYCYLVSKTGLMDDSKNLAGEAGKFKKDTDTVIDTVVKLYGAVSDGADHITNSVTEIQENKDITGKLESLENLGSGAAADYQNIMNAANAMADTGTDYFSDPRAILKGLGAVAKDTAFSQAKSIALAAPISKALVKRQVDLYNTAGSSGDILEKLGVVDGMEGLNFTGSTLFNDGKTITVRVTYSMKVDYPFFDLKEFHFIQTVSTEAWGSKK